MTESNVTRRRLVPAAILLMGMVLIIWVSPVPTSSQTQGVPIAPTRPAVAPALSDMGILTEWPLPLNSGPWQLKWDESRNLIWFAEGTHSDPPLDQIGALDPETSVLREWGIPTAGGYVHGTAIVRSFNLWFT